uniref:Uncharacterized protein n=1 Tax=Anguilla anguilla TaxID=7936 RepID=A0A0E9PL54_ANGAN
MNGCITNNNNMNIIIVILMIILLLLLSLILKNDCSIKMMDRKITSNYSISTGL